MFKKRGFTIIIHVLVALGWMTSWLVSGCLANLSLDGGKGQPHSRSCRKPTRAQMGWAKAGCSCYSATHLRGSCTEGFVYCAAFSGWVDNASVAFKRSVCQITDSQQWHLRAVNCETWEKNVHILFSECYSNDGLFIPEHCGFHFYSLPT